jgi:hypothetical protein
LLPQSASSTTTHQTKPKQTQQKTKTADFDEASVAAAGRVDVVVSPVADVLLGGYALVRGDSDLVKVRSSARFCLCLNGACVYVCGLSACSFLIKTCKSNNKPTPTTPP